MDYREMIGLAADLYTIGKAAAPFGAAFLGYRVARLYYRAK